MLHFSTVEPDTLELLKGNTNPDSRWTSATILMQSMILFPITLLLCATPHLWNDTYAYFLEGRRLPAITQWMRVVAPGGATGGLCLAIMVSLTHSCIGLLLLATATTKLIATQRVVFLGTTTWGIVILCSITAFVAQALPFAHIIPVLVLPTDAQAAQSRAWIFWATVYSAVLVTITVVMCRRQRNVE